MLKRQISLILFICLFWLNPAFCQLQKGSIAPDWTLTDIEGKEHHLYSYLNAGKTVYLDFSATWCDPCWIYQQRNHLDHLYNLYGPDGTDEVQVIFIEGDPWTDLDDLEGTGDNTLGDWVSNTSYPIINDFSITDLYNIRYWPTIYKICPNKRIEELGTLTTSALYACVDRCEPPIGDNNAAIFSYNGESGFFCKEMVVNPSITIQNEGHSELQTCKIDFYCNNTLVETKDWSGSISPQQTTDINFAQHYITETTNFRFELHSPNGQQDEVSEYNVLDNISVNAPLSNHSLALNIHTDYWPEEIEWTIFNDTGDTLYQSDDFPALAENQFYSYSLMLPDTGCHIFAIRDSFGDGLVYGPVGGGVVAKGAISLESEGQVLWDDIRYGFGTDVPFEVKSVITNTEEVRSILESNILVSPNPAQDQIQVTFNLLRESRMAIQLFDAAGKLINQRPLQNWSEGLHQIPFNIESFESGLYFIRLQGDSVNESLKFVKN